MSGSSGASASAAAAAASDDDEESKEYENRRTLKRDTSLLKEFDDGESPDLLVLYYHSRDMALDCFNAKEYHDQMVRYYEHGIRLKEVVARKMGGNDYNLVCLQWPEAEKNLLCEVAFSAMRQFCGISMLVKKRCFVCHKRDAKKCSGCHCAYFCSRECQNTAWPTHKHLCKLVDAPSVRIDTEALEIELS